MVNFGGVFCLSGALKGTHRVTAENCFPFVHGLGPMMQIMGCLAKFRPLNLNLLAQTLVRQMH